MSDPQTAAELVAMLRAELAFARADNKRLVEEHAKIGPQIARLTQERDDFHDQWTAAMAEATRLEAILNQPTPPNMRSPMAQEYLSNSARAVIDLSTRINTNTIVLMQRDEAKQFRVGQRVRLYPPGSGVARSGFLTVAAVIEAADCLVMETNITEGVPAAATGDLVRGAS